MERFPTEATHKAARTGQTQFSEFPAAAMPGGAFPPHDRNAPIFTGIDIAGFVAATVITLGPLAAYSFGLGA
jgi:hypothetical protein